jgi:hypothetical protein
VPHEVTKNYLEVEKSGHGPQIGARLQDGLANCPSVIILVYLQPSVGAESVEICSSQK